MVQVVSDYLSEIGVGSMVSKNRRKAVLRIGERMNKYKWKYEDDEITVFEKCRANGDDFYDIIGHRLEEIARELVYWRDVKRQYEQDCVIEVSPKV